MKVTVKYCVEYVKTVEMSPEEYCNARANFDESGLFPEDCFNRNLSIGKDAEDEMYDFFVSRQKNC